MRDYLTEIYDELPDCNHHGHYLSAFCPFPEHHSNQHRRSLMIYADWFRCLSCDRQGKPEYLLRYLQSSNGIIIVREETKKFRNPWNDWLYIESISTVLKKAQRLVKDHPSQAAYWKSRGLTAKAIKKLKVGWLDGYNTIPIKNRKGKIIGGVARASETTESLAKYVTPSRFHQDNNKLLYVASWKRLKRAEKVYLAFGIISAMSIHLCGESACAPLTGKKVNPEILKDIRRPIIIVPDKGEEKEAYKLANQLGWRGTVKILPYHDDVLDPNDLFIHNKELLIKSL